ncbi:MAG: tetratricopeptide repeat protein, partial [Gemmatimonadota bacterium]
DLGRAEREASAVLEAQPDNPEALEALAQFQAWSGDVEEALASYDQLTSIAPESGSVGRSRAQALAWASRYQASRAAYDSLLARDPADVDARLGLARMLAYQQDFTGAIAEYDRVMRVDPGEIRAWIGRARTLGWSGRLVAGEEVAVTAVDIDRSNAEAWAVLGQLYVWEGRNAAALEALETAATLAPTNAPVQDQLRAVRLTMAPDTRPSVVYESDSDDNRMVTTSLSGSWHPVPRLDVRLDGFYKDLQQGIFSRTAQGATVSARYQMTPGWRFSGGVGGVHSNSTRSTSLADFRLGVRSPERHPLVVSVDASSSPLTETAALAELGGRSTGVVLAARYSPTGLWRLDGSLGIGRYEGREDNGRRSAALAGAHRLGRFFSVGASMRAFSFEKNLDDGYFDPDFYGIAELTSYWQYRPLPWSFLVELAPGIQKVTSDGDVGTTLRSNTRAGYQFAPGREISLSFGYSSAGLVSFATGDSSYRYTAFILGSSWAF